MSTDRDEILEESGSETEAETEAEATEETEEEQEPAPGWAQTIINAHLDAAAAADRRRKGQRDGATIPEAAVSHAARMQSRRYFVWQEDGSNDLNADNGHDETAMTGYTDLFTEVEFDPAARALGPAFDAAGIAWEYTGCSYEPDTGLFHHTWEWEVAA